MAVSGYLQIKTRINNDEVDKGVKQLEDKIKKLQTDNSKNSQEQSNLENEITAYERLQQEADKYKNKVEELSAKKFQMTQQDKSLIFGGNTNQEYTKISQELNNIFQKYQQTTAEIDKQAPKINNVYSKLDKVKAKQTENNTKISEYKKKIESIKTQHIENSLDNVGKGISKQISQIGRMAMGIVGIRTAWGAVRSAISLVSQYDTQTATNLEYMRYVLASAITPLVQNLVSLAMTLLSYINAITSAWFGINLFSNGSVKNFQKMKNSAGGTSKAVKEIKKSLAGFDEMNILQDNSENGSGTTAGGVSPSMDLNGMQAEIPAWLKWIIDNKDLVLAIIAGITAALISMKVLGFDPLLSLGIGLVVGALVKLIQDTINFLNDPTWANFVNILEDIAVGFAGIGLIIGTLTGNWIPLIIAAIALIVVEVIKHWDEIMAILEPIGQWIYDNIIMPVWNFIKGLIDWIVAGFWGLLSIIDGITTTLGEILKAPFQMLFDIVKSVFNGIKTILQGILQVFKGIFTGDMKTVLNGFKTIFKGIFDSLWGIAKAPLNLIIRGINALIDGANKIHFDVPDWVPGMGGKKFGFNISKIPLLAKGTVVSKPTPAIIGEAGAEMVMPLENNLEYLDKLATMLASKIGGSGPVNIYLDSRLIKRQIAQREQEFAFNTNE